MGELSDESEAVFFEPLDIDEASGDDDASTRGRPKGRRATYGRPSTGPIAREPPMTSVATEVFDISSWPGTAEAARTVGRHVSTIKLWRQQGRIRAQQDEAGCWRYNPDDLAESMSEPEAPDAGTILATGMASIVEQAANANARLIQMTEVSTTGLKEACTVLAAQLAKAYERIGTLEKERSELLDKASSQLAETFKHERYLKKIQNAHELELSGARESSDRLAGLLKILGPIAASVAARLSGDEKKARGIEAAVTSPTRPIAIETRITEAMARLAQAVTELDLPSYQGLRAMLPADVASALDTARSNESTDEERGRALAVIVRSVQKLSPEQFAALSPLVPRPIGIVLGQLRALLEEDAVAQKTE